MTLQRFQGIVLRLGNQMFVRHYLWLNYPNDPQLMGIELIGQAPNGKKRKATCECGTCQKCLHREYMRGYRPSGRLATELESEGFRFNEETGIWAVERDDAKHGTIQAEGTTGVNAESGPESASQDTDQDAVASVEAEEGRLVLAFGLFPICRHCFMPRMNCDCDVPFEPLRSERTADSTVPEHSEIRRENA
jgi:hypothetical protein